MAVYYDVSPAIVDKLRGTRLRATVPVREAVINSFLNSEVAAGRGRAKQFEIRVLEGNRLQAGVLVSIGPFLKWLRPEIAIDPAGLWSGSPGVLLTFAGAHYGAAAKLVEVFARGSLPPGVHIGNGRIAVDLGKLPSAAPFRRFFQHLKRLQFSSRTGVLWMEAEVEVS